MQSLDPLIYSKNGQCTFKPYKQVALVSVNILSRNIVGRKTGKGLPERVAMRRGDNERGASWKSQLHAAHGMFAKRAASLRQEAPSAYGVTERKKRATKRRIGFKIPIMKSASFQAE
jgi:hypothetical protein